MTLLTEKEAAEKWCPMAVNSTQLRGDSGRALPECIGSRCMAWRRVVIGHDFDNPKDGIAPSVYAGYCGAFGKVEP